MTDRRVCARCERELPFRDDGRETRRWCSQVCRQLAYIDRKKTATDQPPEPTVPD